MIRPRPADVPRQCQDSAGRGLIMLSPIRFVQNRNIRMVYGVCKADFGKITEVWNLVYSHSMISMDVIN
jgi:hypothetical protein